MALETDMPRVSRTFSACSLTSGSMRAYKFAVLFMSLNIHFFVRTKAIHFENFLKFTKTHMSVEVKSGVCGLVSASKYNSIAMSDYDKIGRIRCFWSRGG